MESTSDAPRVGEVAHEARSRRCLERLDTDLCTSAATFGAELLALGAQREAGIVLVPERQRKRRERLEVVLAQHLLAADVDRMTQLGQLRHRREVEEDRTLRVR